ncbi:MAG: DPP IV N-terminal domain-containing protein [Actinomycetota bacterium]
MDADGTGRVQLTHNRAMDYHAAWSPDGTRIAFNREVDHRQDLWVINPDGSDPTNLTPGLLLGGSPSWSPDGTKMAFVRNREIYVMDADGSDVVQLTTNTWRDTSPAWSPDGTLIAFYSDRYGAADIWFKSASGGGLTRVTDTPRKSEFDPDWQPLVP